MKYKFYEVGPICPDCGEICYAIPLDNSFDYAGTHCTGGKPGTHYPSDYGTPVSNCCEVSLDIEIDDEK